MSDVISINGTVLPPLEENGLNITKEKIWSSKTSRGGNAEMLGDIIAYKYTLKCQWMPLSREETALIDSLISLPFFSVTFTDPASNSRKTINAYAGTPAYPIYSYKDGKPYRGVTVDLIEK